MHGLTGMDHVGLIHQLGRSIGRIQTSAGRLSSGLRIQSPGDDPAGLGMSARMLARIRSMAQAERNVGDAISAMHVAEGGLSEASSLLVRLRELAVHSANGSLSDHDRTQLQGEFAALRGEIDRIAKTTGFSHIQLLDGSLIATSSTSTTTTTTTTTVATAPAAVTAGTAQTQALTRKEKLIFDNYGIFAGLTGLQRQIDFDVGDTQLDVVNKINGDPTIGALVQASIDAGGFLRIEAITGGVADTFRVGSNHAAASDTTGIGTTTLTGTTTTASTTTTTTTTTTTIDGGLTVQLGIHATPEDSVTISLGSVQAADLGIAGLDIGSRAGALAAMAAVDAAQQQVTVERAAVGSWINRLGHAIHHLRASQETEAAAVSRIRDADVAKETSTLVRERLRQQTILGVLRQWAESPAPALSLLERGPPSQLAIGGLSTVTSARQEARGAGFGVGR